MSPSDSAEWGCLLPFDTDEPEFARGFEMGRLWERCKVGGEIKEMIHAENAEMAMRIAEATGREFSAERLDDEWVELTLSDGICGTCGEFLSDCEGHDGDGLRGGESRG